MELQSAWNLLLDLIANDWQVVVLLCGSILALKGLKVVNGGLFAQLSNLIGSALASGLLKNVSFTNGLKLVFFSAASALLYHFLNKIVFPNANKMVAELKAKK